MKSIRGKTYDICEWCDSTDTIWDAEPDAYINDHPPEVTEDGKLYVTLSRYCRECEQCYDVILRFDVNDGLRVDEVKESERIMTLCPKCGAILLVTTAGEICQNCGWRSVGSTGWVSDNTVNLPLITKPSGAHLLVTDTDVLLNRVSALEAKLEKLEKIIREKDEESKSQEKSTKDKLTLRPCPFCDSRDIHTYEPTVYEVGNDASVECQECGAEIRASTLKTAIAKWNRRAKE